MMPNNKILNSIRKHSFAVIMAVVFGLLLVFPFFYFESKLGKDYKGIFPAIEPDSTFYYSRVNDVVDGHPMLGNAYLWEHKNELPQSIFLTEYLLAQPIKLFNLDINTARLIYNFLLPIVSFLLAYAAFYIILKKRYWALAFSAFLFFGLYLFSFIRPVSPQFNFIFWLTQFIFLYLFISERKNKWFWLSIVNFGFLFYVYPYYWTYYLIFFGILAAFYFFKERDLSFKISKIAIGGLVLAIPYFYLNYLSYKLPYYAETMTRLGMVNTHFPSYARIVLGSVMGLLVFCWILRKKILNPDSAVLFFIAGILTGIVAINQNVITGRNFEFLIHYEMAAVFFLMLAMAYLMKQFSLNPIKPAYGNKLAILAIFSVVVFSGLADYWVSASGAALFLILAAVYLFIPISPNSVKLARGIKLAAVAVFLFAVFSGLRFYWINISAVSASANTIYIQKYAPIFSWLKNNTVPDSVVYANERLSDFIPVYTADNVFYHRDANYFFISDREVLERFIINNFFEKFDDEFIVRNCYSIVGVRFAEAYRYAEQGRRFWRLLGLKPGSEIYLPDEEIIKIMDKARELQKKDFIQELKKYRVDYLIWDKIENPGWRIDLGYFKKVYEADSLVIFKPI